MHVACETAQQGQERSREKMKVITIPSSCGSLFPFPQSRNQSTAPESAFQIAKESDHYIQISEAELVADAITELTAAPSQTPAAGK